jgi:hypothetical protein
MMVGAASKEYGINDKKWQTHLEGVYAAIEAKESGIAHHKATFGIRISVWFSL